MNPCVLSQVPFLDGKDSFKQNVKTRGYLRIFRAFAAGVHDTLRSLFHYPAAYFPLATKDGKTAFMQLDAKEWEAYTAKHPAVKQVRDHCKHHRHLSDFDQRHQTLTSGCVQYHQRSSSTISTRVLPQLLQNGLLASPPPRGKCGGVKYWHSVLPVCTLRRAGGALNIACWFLLIHICPMM